jgi:molecular chaperone HscB
LEPAAAAPAALRLDSDDFTLFGLPRRFTLARTEIDGAWRRLQAATHPDRHVHAGASAQRLAMQWAVRVNEAHQRLKDPVRRAALLCELHGVPVQAETHTAMPPAFLHQQLQWREQLEEATSLGELQAVESTLDDAERACHQRLAELLDALENAALRPAMAEAIHQAAGEVRALMFMTRFRQEVDRRLEQMA